MATVAVWLASTAKPLPITHKKATLKSGRLVLTVPVTNPSVTHTLREPDWVQIPRLGNQPLMRKGNPRMPQMHVDVTFTTDTGNVDAQLAQLEAIANSSTPITVGNWSGMEAGFWWVTAMSITSQSREEGTNSITKATVALTFTRAPYNSYKAVTVTAPKPVKPPPVKPGVSHPAGGSAAGRPKTYVVRSGDTLTAIAARFYGDPDKYAAIAAANRIKNPNLIYPGQKLILP
jgi:LysM repeat protein